MPYPLSQSQINARYQCVKQKKEDELDIELAEEIARREVNRNCTIDYEELERTKKRVLSLIKEAVDPPILAIIFSNNPLDGHDVHIQRKRENKYNPEDTVAKKVRILIEYAYGEGVPNRVVRQKVVGCMNTIAAKVNRL